MDAICSSLHNRKLKIENSLSDLNKEILCAMNFLLQLQDTGEKIVKKLNSLTSSCDYLKEFVYVSSYLFTYLNVLSEVNCKFEMMQMTEYKVQFEKVKTTKSNDNSTSSDLAVKVLNFLESSKNVNFQNDDLCLSVKETENLYKNLVKEEKNHEIYLNGEEKAKIVKENDCKLDIPQRHIDEYENEFPTSSVCDLEEAKESDEKSHTIKHKIHSYHSSTEGDLNKKISGKENHLVEDEDIKPLNIGKNIGDEFEVSIEYIKSPSEFYVHFKNYETRLLNNLKEKLKLFIPKPVKVKSEGKNLISHEFGKYALYYSKCDEVWCRAEIMDKFVNHKGNYVVSIFLVDYGETKCVSVDSLQPLPDSLKQYPAFAQKCHLYGVCPTEMKKTINFLSWERESCEEMRNWVENSKNIKIKVAPGDKYHSSLSLPVILYTTDTGTDSVNDLLVKCKYAIENLESKTVSSSHVIKQENCEMDNWNPMKEDFESYKNNYDLNINDPAAIIYGYVGKDYDRVCMQYSKTGKCYKGQGCRKEHSRLDPKGYTTDQEEIYKNAFNCLPIPETNEILNIQVTCLLSISEFCCIKESINFVSDEESLNTLVKAINRKDSVKEFKKLLIPPSIGQIVIAQFTEDESWYRGKILDSQPENDAYDILFVDYGNKESIPLSRIRAIEPKYLHLPFQAIFCNIFGVEKNPQVSESKAMAYLNKRFSENLISIEVISRIPGDNLNLVVNVYDHKGDNIGKDLITEGYAVFKKEVLLGNDDEHLPG